MKWRYGIFNEIQKYEDELAQLPPQVRKKAQDNAFRSIFDKPVELDQFGEAVNKEGEDDCC